MKQELDYSRVMYRFIAPIGTAILSVQQLLVNQPEGWVGGSILFIFAVSVFSAFNFSIELADRQLNTQ